jgi:hypothetical protein
MPWSRWNANKHGKNAPILQVRSTLWDVLPSGATPAFFAVTAVPAAKLPIAEPTAEATLVDTAATLEDIPLAASTLQKAAGNVLCINPCLHVFSFSTSLSHLFAQPQ